MTRDVVAGEGNANEHFPLPGGLGSTERGRLAARVQFDAAADLYDAARPGYPPEMFTELAARCSLDAHTRVLEIGCGTGQATRDLAAFGCEIECVELGPDLAALARRNLAAYPRVSIRVAPFEDVDLPPASHDLVFAATAFHWIDPAIAFPKAASALRPGAFLALVTNAHVAGGTQDEVADDIQSVQQHLASEIGAWEFPSVETVSERALAGGDIAQVWSRIDRRFADPPDVSELFEPPFVAVYPSIATYDSAQFVDMLATQSPYLLIDPAQRDRVLEGIAEVIDRRLGGTITKQYLAVLALARRIATER